MSIRCEFAGTLGRDPELKTSKAGKPYLVLSVAVQLDADNTQWVRTMVFQGIEEMTARLYKGDHVSVTGKLKLATWQGKDGKEKVGLDCLANSIQLPSARAPESSAHALF